jgi:hypothetical protein
MRNEDDGDIARAGSRRYRTDNARTAVVRSGAECVPCDGVHHLGHGKRTEQRIRPPSAVSLSFRFDASDRSFVYSGDTGPSDALVELARVAALLISEMIDDELLLAAMRRPGAPFVQSQASGQPGIDNPAASTSSHSARAASVCFAIRRRTSPIG